MPTPHSNFTYERVQESWVVSCKDGDWGETSTSRSKARDLAHAHQVAMSTPQTLVEVLAPEPIPERPAAQVEAPEISEEIEDFPDLTAEIEAFLTKYPSETPTEVPEEPKRRRTVRKTVTTPETAVEAPEPIFGNREEWLNNLVEAIRPLYGDELPANIRISTGFTSKGARSKRVGECWRGEASGDGTPQIFVTPGQVDPFEVAAIAAHELIHACRPDAKHGPEFRAVAVKLGLDGAGTDGKVRMTSTVATGRFLELVEEILEKLGPYPHAKLSPGTGSNGPKQTTRLLKRECPDCGYTIRITQKWVDVAEPRCPVDDVELRG